MSVEPSMPSDEEFASCPSNVSGRRIARVFISPGVLHLSKNDRFRPSEPAEGKRGDTHDQEFTISKCFPRSQDRRS